MSEGLHYLDTSALVKLVLPKAETGALLEALTGMEVLRAVRRAGDSESTRDRAANVVARVGLMRSDEAVLSRAARLEPPELRTLDAIHFATTLSTGEDLGAMVCYDARLAQTAARPGVTTMAPGRKD